jgi:hypothetical protein
LGGGWSGPRHCGVRSGLLSNRWWVALKSTCENQPSNNSNPLQKEGNPTTEGDYTLYERSVVAKNKNKKLANVYSDWGWEGWGVYGPMWGFVVIGVVWGVGVVADGGCEGCFGVVCGGFEMIWWVVWVVVRCEEWAA